MAAQIEHARRLQGSQLLVMGPLFEAADTDWTEQQATKAVALTRTLTLLRADWVVPSEADRGVLHRLRDTGERLAREATETQRLQVELGTSAEPSESVDVFDGIGGGEDTVTVRVRHGRSRLWFRSAVGALDLLQAEHPGQLANQRLHLPMKGPTLLEVFEAFGGLHVREVPLDGRSLHAPEVRDVLEQTFSSLHIERWGGAAQAKDSASHVGSRMCAACHAGAYAWWRASGHGQAYSTLQRRSRAGDDGCVPCHVTAFDGTRLARADPAEFHGVGCESCHGAGGQHIELPRSAKLNVRRTVPEETCRSCHDADHGGTFAYSRRLRELVGSGHGR